jgi:hypothetical protein
MVVSGLLRALFGHCGFNTQLVDMGLGASSIVEVSSLFAMPDKVEKLDHLTYEECLNQIQLLSQSIDKLNKALENFDEESLECYESKRDDVEGWVLRHRYPVDYECDQKRP